MKKMLLIVPVAALLIGAASLLRGGGERADIDPSFYTVAISGFSDSVYGEQTSKYILSSSDPNFALPDTPFQKIVGHDRGADATRITLLAGPIDPSRNGVFPAYLENTRYLNIDSAEIQGIRRRFAASPDPVRDVERFVYGAITNKTYGIPIISARDILKTKTGDCTEHAILTVSILRALNMPARAVVGMLLSREFGGLRNVFVFHMWAEAHVNGKWALADSTRPGDGNHNLYIAFSHHHLKTEMPLEYLKSIAAIKNLTVAYMPNK
jgi:transglutaminase-like putative cysteine protease